MKIVINNTEKVEGGFKIGQQIMIRGSARQIDGLNSCINSIRALLSEIDSYSSFEDDKKKGKERDCF